MPEPARPGKLQRQYGGGCLRVFMLPKLVLAIAFLLGAVFWNPNFPWISLGFLAVGYLLPLTPFFWRLGRNLFQDKRVYLERRLPPEGD
jgi:ABC-type Fe3+ transport system permease subunit